MKKVINEAYTHCSIPNNVAFPNCPCFILTKADFLPLRPLRRRMVFAHLYEHVSKQPDVCKVNFFPQTFAIFIRNVCRCSGISLMFLCTWFRFYVSFSSVWKTTMRVDFYRFFVRYKYRCFYSSFISMIKLLDKFQVESCFWKLSVWNEREGEKSGVLVVTFLEVSVPERGRGRETTL